MATSAIADLLAPFAEAASIRLHDTSGTLRKRILVSLQFADIEHVHASLFPDEHLDWPAVRAYLAADASSTMGAPEWVRLVTLLHFVAEPPLRPPFAELLNAVSAGAPMSAHIARDPLHPTESLRLCFARARMKPSWDLVCKALLLVNLADVDAAAALSLLFTQEAPLAVDAQGGSIKIEAVLRHLPAASRHSREEYTRAFAHLLAPENCHVANHVIQRSIQQREQAHERVRQTQLALLRSTEKPSLTRILQARVEAAQTSSLSSTLHGLRAFCHRARLPGNLNHHLRLACYYVAVMPAVDLGAKLQAIRRLAGEDAALIDTEAITEMLLSITTGDAASSSAATRSLVDGATLREFITLHVQHVGTPCASLQRFRNQCMPSTVRSPAISWTAVLRLYLAAYCPPPINKEIWDRIVQQLLSTNASAATNAGGSALLREGDPIVQAYVRSTPPDVHELVVEMALRGG